MVGGLVAKIKPKVVFLILGAVNETKSQFIDDLFAKYTDLKEYIPIDFQNKKDAKDKYKKYKEGPTGKKYVIVVSQENLRAKISNEYCLSNPDYEGEICDDYYIKNCNKKNKTARLNCTKHNEKIADVIATQKNNDKYIKKNKSRSVKTTEDEEKEYDNVVIATIKDFLKEDDKIVFFDEVHQGSGPDAMQEQTISFFYNYKNIITEDKYVNPLFIMVTATYTKPLGKYGSTNKTLDGEDIVLIDWNYNMMMAMKQFNLGLVIAPEQTQLTPNPEQAPRQYLIDDSDYDFKGKMKLLQTITEEYNQNGKTCEDIALEYYRNPELVYLLPTITAKFDPNRTNYNDTTKSENSKVPDIGQIFELETGKKTFKNETTVNKYLNYIYEIVYDKLLRIKYGFIANGEGKVHSQLWFLPTNLQNSDDNKGSAGGIIGPLMELLGKLIIENPLYQNFNVCVINSVNRENTEPIVSKSDEKKIRSEYENKLKGIEDRMDEIIKDKDKDKEDEFKILDEEKAKIKIKLNDKKELDKECRKVFLSCIKLEKDESVGECIKQREIESKNNNKSLIILTAQRLRLGISLPCVDVAIHMDTLKSYDIIYQSMFRVLTERSGKKQGFFVDMYLERAVQFFYKYTKIQKHIKLDEETDEKDLDKNRNKMIENMMLFDAGCIKSAIGYTPSTAVVNSYHQIAMDFQVDSKEKYKELEDTVITNLKNKDDEQMIDQNLQHEPITTKQVTYSDSTIQQQIKNIIEIFKKLPKTDKEELLNKITTMNTSNYSRPKDITKKDQTDTQAGVEPFMAEAELENNQAGPPVTPVTSVTPVTQEDKQSEIKLFQNAMEQIKNIFTLIILFGGDDITLDKAINTEQLDYDKIKRLCESNDAELTEEIDNVMYYCYLIQNQEKQLRPGDIVIKKNNEGDNVETGIILKIVKQYICRDISKCLKDGQKIRFTHDKNLIATYKKNGNKLVYNDDEYESLNKLLKQFYEIVGSNSGLNAWSHFEIEISPDNWSPMMELEIKPPDINVISPTSEYTHFLKDIDNNEYRCKPNGQKPKESKPKESKPKESKPKESKPKESKPKESKPKELMRKLVLVEATEAKDEPEESKSKESKSKESKSKESKSKESKSNESKQTRKKKISQVQVVSTLENDKLINKIYETIEQNRLVKLKQNKETRKFKKKTNEKTSDTMEDAIDNMIGGASGTPNEEKTTYYILWNPDKTEPEQCIEKYDDASLEKNVIMPKLTADEIQEIIEKYIGQNGIINFLIEKEKESGNKGELNNLFTYIKEEMKRLGQRIEKEKEGFDEEAKEDSDICSEFFKTDSNEKVLETIRRYLTPKKEEQDLFGEVFTPLELVCEMLSKLPHDVWKNPDYTWFDPANGIGNFPVVAYYKLMKTLSSVPEKKRSKHIIENMLYMNELNKVNVGICRRIFKMIDPTARPNIFLGDFLKKKEFKGVNGKTITEFDVIIGNPPYNKSRIMETSDTPLYSDFIVNCDKITKKYLTFIVPSRWFSGGKGLNEFRKFMLSRSDIEYIQHIPNSKTIWPTIDIKGGVNYFLINKSYNGLTNINGHKIKLNKYDILLPNYQAYPIIEKVINSEETLDKLYLSTSYFGINTNFSEFTDNKKLVPCYVSKQKGGIKYVDEKYITKDYKFWKVFTPQGSGKGGDGFGNLILGHPSEIASQTYFSLKVNSKSEAESLISYLKTNFANFLLSLRKIDQHISEETLKWIPLPELNKSWTDASIMEHYKLSIEDKKIVEGFGKHEETKEIKKPRQTKGKGKGKKGGSAPGKKRTRKNKTSDWKLW